MDELIKAKSILLDGGILIYPTETVYGIGCLINFPNSIAKLYQIKNRDRAKPTAVLVKSKDFAKKFIDFNPTAERLADAFWPGPLTICLPPSKNVPKEILGADKTLGVRVPALKWLSRLLNSLDQPLLAPSANLQGSKPPSKRGEIDKNLAKLVDYVVNIEPGGQRPSTVVSFSDKMRYKVIREGSISTKKLSQVLLVD